MDNGDSRKLGSFSGSALSKKSMNFLRDAYSLAEKTFSDRPEAGQGQHSALSHQFNNNTTTTRPPAANPYLQPSAALSPHPQQQWPRPPPSPNRPQPSPTQTPSPGPYANNMPPHLQQVSAAYVPGQGMVSKPFHMNSPMPQRYDSAALATDPHANLPPPPPYSPSQHVASPPQPQTQHQHRPSWDSAQQQAATSNDPSRPPSATPQPDQQAQWGHSTSGPQQPPRPSTSPRPDPSQQTWHQQAPIQQHAYQAYSPTQASHPSPPIPQRHPSAPDVQYRPYQHQPHHANTYPFPGVVNRPSTSHSEHSQANEQPPPLPQRPQWQQAPSPQPTAASQQYNHPPAGYAELPSPPQQPPQRPQEHAYFAPPPGVAEMYAPPPPAPAPAPPSGYSELPGSGPAPQQQQQQYMAYNADSKPPMHNQGQQYGGHNVPHIAELPG